jgi:hypothetical protein
VARGAWRVARGSYIHGVILPQQEEYVKRVWWDCSFFSHNSTNAGHKRQTALLVSTRVSDTSVD